MGKFGDSGAALIRGGWAGARRKGGRMGAAWRTRPPPVAMPSSLSSAWMAAIRHSQVEIHSGIA